MSFFVGLMSFLVGVYTLYIYTRVCHGSAPGFLNSGHLFSRSNYFIIFSQLWPLGFMVINLYPLF